MKKEEKNYCLKCGSYDVKVLSTGEILCQNKSCLAISPRLVECSENEMKGGNEDE